MAQYRLYHLEDFELAAAEDLEATDDVEAAALARARATTGVAELWRGGRRVRTILRSAAQRT